MDSDTSFTEAHWERLKISAASHLRLSDICKRFLQQLFKQDRTGSTVREVTLESLSEERRRNAATVLRIGELEKWWNIV